MFEKNTFFFIVAIVVIIAPGTLREVSIAFAVVAFFAVEVAFVVVVGDPVGRECPRSSEWFSFAALCAGNEVDDVTSGVQTSRSSIWKTLANAVLTHYLLFL